MYYMIFFYLIQCGLIIYVCIFYIRSYLQITSCIEQGGRGGHREVMFNDKGGRGGLGKCDFCDKGEGGGV